MNNWFVYCYDKNKNEVDTCIIEAENAIQANEQACQLATANKYYICKITPYQLTDPVSAIKHYLKCYHKYHNGESSNDDFVQLVLAFEQLEALAQDERNELYKEYHRHLVSKDIADQLGVSNEN